MKPIGVFYATREGHTGRIAARVAETLQDRGFDVQVRDLGAHPALRTNDSSREKVYARNGVIRDEQASKRHQPARP